MSSPNILLTRIDNRLVHGQVGVTWTSTIGANLLVVVDDVVANDDIQQKLMGITADSHRWWMSRSRQPDREPDGYQYGLREY